MTQAPTHSAAGVVTIQGNYGDWLRGLLWTLLRDVVKHRAPKALTVLDEPETLRDAGTDTNLDSLQAANIWFQLLRIANENAMVKGRRRVETNQGRTAIKGSFARTFDRLVDKGVDLETIDAAANSVFVGPTLTAHPTEAKRETVLDIHRRIYRAIVKLESNRWTPRERDMHVETLRNEIDLLWVDGGTTS